MILLEKLGAPLPKLSVLVDWDGFRPLLNRIRQKERKSAAGCKPFDVVADVQNSFSAKLRPLLIVPISGSLSRRQSA